MEYVIKLCEVMKRNANKSSVKREALSKNDIEEIQKKYPGLSQIKNELFEIREKLGLLTKEEVINERAKDSGNLNRE
ncbi:MAG TPA: hypothetical protein PLQ81_13720 [bacterium]|nr:hypothetical protein [bacterium]